MPAPTAMSMPLIWLFFFIVVALIILSSTLIKKKFTIAELSIIGLMGALALVAYMFLKIPVPMFGSNSSIHLGNMFPALTALLLDGVSGGLAGAIGLTLADLFTGHAEYIITTFILKYLIGFTCGLVAHRLMKVRDRAEEVTRIRAKYAGRKIGKAHKQKIAMYYVSVVVSLASGLVLNIFTDPFLGYFRKIYIQGLSTNFADVLTKISSATTAFNSLVCLIVGVALYLVLYPALKRSNLLKRI